MLQELTNAAKIETLWAHHQLEQLMIRLARGIDRGEWSLYRSCFTEQINVNFERSTGFPEVCVNADLWTRFAALILAPVRRHHQFSNFCFETDGDHAQGVIYLVARHWKATDGGASEFVQNGWYENAFARIEGEWKITRMLHTHSWISGNGALLSNHAPEVLELMKQVFCEANFVKR